VIVELNLFCPFYEDNIWDLSPMNARNNVNWIGKIARTNVYTLDRNGALLGVQEQMVRKIVTELKDFDNVYYEICNEPYFGGVTIEWQRHIADIITETELPLRVRHLISQNIANEKAQIQNPHPEVSIFNFHYATPPDTVAMNYGLNRVIGDNETGFRGTNDAAYRMEAWDFIVAGGGLFNNLDYSFTVKHEEGTFIYPAKQPGGGSIELRKQLKFLAGILRSLDFVHMQPANQAVKSQLPPGISVRVMARPGEDYLVYLHGPREQPRGDRSSYRDGEIYLDLALPSGEFKAEWLDTQACCPRGQAQFTQWDGGRKFSVPAFEEDIALLVRRRTAE
ncbi:MAG: hypothetical protein ACREIC_18070, partial [Limisphaerales bacterium]